MSDGAQPRAADNPRLYSVDILRACCALMVVCIHTGMPGQLGASIRVFCRSAVPVFFMITGYFCADGIGGARGYRLIHRTLLLIVQANAIYLIWHLLMAWPDMGEYLRRTFTAERLVRFVLVNESPIRGHLWYLDALLYTLVIAAAAERLRCMRLLEWATPLLLLGDLVLGKYAMVLFHREFSPLLVRNFLFVGIPNFCIGLWIRRGLGRGVPRPALLGMILAFSATSLAEWAALTRTGMSTQREHYISTTFLAAALLLFTLSFTGQARTAVGRLAAKIGRRDAVWVYILHLIWVGRFNVLAKMLGCSDMYQRVAPLAVYAASLLTISAARGIGRDLRRVFSGRGGAR